MKILLVGLSHKTAPVEVRECLAFSPNMLRSALTHFDKTHHQHGKLDGVREGVILSTCNRLEVYALIDSDQSQQAIIDFLSRSQNVPTETFIEHLYIYEDEAAVHHLMRVASGLDSMVLGEPQILGQITDAYEAALSQGAAGTVLSALFRAAIHAGKRARTDTAIGVNPSSISSVAAAMAVDLLGDLTHRQVLLIGAGEMGAIAVKSLINRGVSNITVANRTFANAEQLARVWGGRAISFQQLMEGMVGADIIISSTGAPHTILDRDMLEPVMAKRPNRPLFLIDIAVPRDINPNVGDLNGIHLRDIDDLQSQVADNVREREEQVPHVERIVENEAEQFLEWVASLDVVSTIRDLRKQVETVRQQELERFFNRLDLDEREQEQVMMLTHRLVNKILHRPTIGLKQAAVDGDGAAYVSMVRQLFDLDTPPYHTNGSNGNGHHGHGKNGTMLSLKAAHK